MPSERVLRVARSLRAAGAPVTRVPPGNPHLPARLHVPHIRVDPSYLEQIREAAFNRRHGDSRSYPWVEFDVPGPERDSYRDGAPIYVEFGDQTGFYARMRVEYNPGPEAHVTVALDPRYSGLEGYLTPEVQKSYLQGYERSYPPRYGKPLPEDERLLGMVDRGHFDSEHHYPPGHSVPGLTKHVEQQLGKGQIESAAHAVNVVEQQLPALIASVADQVSWKGRQDEGAKILAKFIRRKRSLRRLADHFAPRVSHAILNRRIPGGVDAVRRLVLELLDEFDWGTFVDRPTRDKLALWDYSVNHGSDSIDWRPRETIPEDYYAL